MSTPPSGEQFEIELGTQRATIVEVGGGIRTYTVENRDVLEPFALDAVCDGAHGAVLIPWPNRLEDGRYSFGGAEHQLALSEPECHNAIHGLLRWRSWRAVERSASSVTVGIVLHPTPGYPFALDVAVRYELRHDGLHVHTTALNIGDGPCPFGAGHHPYLSGGGGPLDACALEFSATTRLTTDERRLPRGREAVKDTALDFAVAREIGDTVIDAPFTDLGADTVSLRGPDGATVTLWADRRYPVLQLFTGDTLASHRRRRGLAAEPMTCPPNALRTGEQLLTLEPGQGFAADWSVGLS